MIIYNWPDSCPKCGCTEFEASSYRGSEIALPNSEKKVGNRFDKRRLFMRCRDVSCLNHWQVELATPETIDPVIIFKGERENPPFVVFEQERGEGFQVLGLEKGAKSPKGWKAIPLSVALKQTAKRVAIVARSIANALKESAKEPVADGEE